MPRAKGVTSTPRGDLRVAVGYVRVSTDEQHLGPEAQRQGIAQWCVKHRIRLVGCHVDQGVSGGSLPSDRAGFNAALDQIRSTGAGWLVALVRDRLAREAHYAGHAETIVERLGARIITTEEAPGTEDSIEAGMIRTVRDMAARAEKANIKRRITQALAVKSARGERVGSLPFGWSADRGPRSSKSDAPARLIPNEEEQVTIAIIRSLREAGKSCSAIAQALTRQGRPCRGSYWHHTTVQRILKRDALTTGARSEPSGAYTPPAAPHDSQPGPQPQAPRERPNGAWGAEGEGRTSASVAQAREPEGAQAASAASVERRRSGAPRGRR